MMNYHYYSFNPHEVVDSQYIDGYIYKDNPN